MLMECYWRNSRILSLRMLLRNSNFNYSWTHQSLHNRVFCLVLRSVTRLSVKKIRFLTSRESRTIIDTPRPKGTRILDSQNQLADAELLQHQ